MSFKLIAVVNKELESGVALNALGHMALGFGAAQGKEALRLDDYQDKSANLYPHISQMPFIILRGKNSEIRTLVKKSTRAFTASQDFVKPDDWRHLFRAT